MTVTAHDLLVAFDTLDPAEKQQVAAEILLRSAGVADVQVEALDELAAELFQVYEAEEAADADG